MDEQLYKLAMERAYADELLMLQDCLEKISAQDEYEGPKVRHAAGIGAAGGAGALAARGLAKRKTKKLTKQIKNLQAVKAHSEAIGKAWTPGKGAIHGPEYYEGHKKTVETAGKNIKKLQKALPKKWKAPLVGAAAVGAPVAGIMAARSRKGKRALSSAGEKVRKGYERARPYI